MGVSGGSLVFHCLLKGTVCSHFSTERGLGWRCSVFITQFLVLHDVKKQKPFFPHDTAQSIGHCPTGCPSLLVVVGAQGAQHCAVGAHVSSLSCSSGSPQKTLSLGLACGSSDNG